MKDKIFLDSNIILYSYLEQDRFKKEKSLKILAEMDCVLSNQVVGEVCFNLLKKAKFNE